MVKPRARAVGNGTFADVVSPMGEFAPTEIEAGRVLNFVEQKQRDGFLSVLRGLSPGEERMIQAVYAALALTSDPAKSQRFRAYVTRTQIAAQLGRQGGLVPHDVRVLNDLVKRELVMMGQHPRKPKTFVGVDGLKKQLGAGWEYVYGLPHWLIVALLWQVNPGAFGAVNPSPVSSLGLSKTELQPASSSKYAPFLDQLDDYEIAVRYRGKDYTSDTHIYTWDNMIGKHRKRPKPRGFLGRMKSFLENV